MQPPKTIIIGANGYIGKFFHQSYLEFYSDSLGIRRKDLDLLNPQLKKVLPRGHDYKDALILAGVSKVARCENETNLAKSINVAGIGQLIEQCIDLGVRPVFASTDYVFDGKTGKYTETSSCAPTTHYGKQKLEIEQLLPELCGDNYLIVRFSKVYSSDAGDDSLLNSMAYQLIRQKALKVATDQFFCPTHIDDVLRGVHLIQASGESGVFHVCSDEVWKRYDIAIAIAEELGVSKSLVEPISLLDMDDIARPLNTSMTPARLKKMIDWKPISLRRSIQKIGEAWKK